MIKRKQYGFTLVELLIVIVIIAILAAITVVAYNGIQNRANDSAVQSDLRGFANLVLQYQAVNGGYPTPAGKTKPPGTDSFYASQGSYATNVHNFIYCEGHPNADGSGTPIFAVGAVSKSGNMYVYYGQGGLQQYTGSWYGGAVASVCPALGINAPDGTAYEYAYGYNNPLGWWPGWTR